MRFQIAQEFHAVSDLHEPPFSVNNRSRDIVDPLLIRDLAAATGRPTLSEIQTAGTAVFEARAHEARHLGRPPRSWPPTITTYPHWLGDFAEAAMSGGIQLSLGDAVAEANAWIDAIHTAGTNW